MISGEQVIREPNRGRAKRNSAYRSKKSDRMSQEELNSYSGKMDG